MKLYVLTFTTYGSEKLNVSVNAWATKAKAEREASQLRACGHKNVQIHRVEYSTK